MQNSPEATVVAVCKKTEPGIPKLEVGAIKLLENLGVEGDYHAGEFVRHRYLAEKDPTRPNVRQVLIIDTAILRYLAGQGIELLPGWMGENIIIDGVSIMTLPIGTRLEIGEAIVELAEIRNPCYQLDDMHPGVLEAVMASGPAPDHRNAGILARVVQGGLVRRGDSVRMESKTG